MLSYLYNNYRIIEKTVHKSDSDLKNQFDGIITKAHAEHLQLAQLDDWEIPKDQRSRPICMVTYAVPVSS